MFSKFNLDFPINLFEQLSESISFEDINNGRKGAILVDCKENNLIPLVRTTTVYHKPSQKFLPVHYHIIDNIKKSIGYDNLEFNNALIEIYNSKYCNMGYHSDQSQDLSKESYICIFSCYNDPTTKELRKLKVKNKITNKCFDIILDHNSIVIFSIDTNQKHLHKIVLENSFCLNKTNLANTLPNRQVLEQNTSNNLWLGITFRQSKTFMTFINELPYFTLTNKILALANTNQRKEFFKCRSLENSSTEYTYPEMNYTISIGDIMPIK